MKLQIVGHPQQRMAERGVTVADIESAIAGAHTTVTGERSVTYIGPGTDGRALKVWALPPGYVDQETTIIIKSVAWKESS